MDGDVMMLNTLKFIERLIYTMDDTAEKDISEWGSYESKLKKQPEMYTRIQIYLPPSSKLFTIGIFNNSFFLSPTRLPQRTRILLLLFNNTKRKTINTIFCWRDYIVRMVLSRGDRLADQRLENGRVDASVLTGLDAPWAGSCCSRDLVIEFA